MDLKPNEFYHIYNQGNNRQTLFFNRENYLYFLRRFREKVSVQGDVLAYCLMPNHFHFLIQTTEKSINQIQIGSLKMAALLNGFRLLESSYAQAINKQENRSGSLFRQKTKIKLVERDASGYLFRLFHYIHQNPLRAGLVSRLEDWEFSSFKDYAGLRSGTLCQKEIAKSYVGYSEEDFMEESHWLIHPDDVRMCF